MAKHLSASVTSTAYKITRTVVGVECDVCGKVIRPQAYKKNETRYFEVTTGHRDWGNDSHESVNTIDICPDCVVKYTSDYLKDARGTEYLDIRTRYIYDEKSTKIVDELPKEGEVTVETHDRWW